MKLIGIDFQMFNFSSSNFLGNWYCVFEVYKEIKFEINLMVMYK